MLPGSIDPRRPDKQQRYKPPPASNNAAPGEDLTPDYMNILDSQRKSMQTPRSDRFKVVKIESTEPFKRGRWKCMDFLDQSYAKVFQQNYNNRPTETRPPSPKNHIDPNKTNSSGSWGSTASYVDLQSSMLQIFYRQNSIENHNACSCDQNSEIICCDAKRKYQNHVLMPGMVSSSLVGIDFPIELNFVPDNAGQLPPVFKDNNTHSFSNNNQSSLAHNNLSCCCKSQTSSIDIQKFHQNMSSDHLTIPASQIANYAQLKQDLIQKNLNVSPQELINQNSGITQYMHNLINNDPNSTLNFSNNQQTLIKEEQIIDNQNGTNIGQMITQNLLPANQSNGSELKSTPFNNNNPIYVNIQNLTCPQQTVNIPESNKNIISDQQITSTSNDSSTPMHLSPLRISESQIKNAIENVCDSTTQAENMAQNNTVINGNYVPNNFVQNSIPNNTDSVQTEYYQNLVQNLDPNNPNMVQKYVVQNIIPNNNIVQNPVSNNTIVPNSVPNNMVQNSAPNNNIVQNTVTNTSMLSNSVSNNNKVQNSVPNNLVQNSVPTNNIVQTTVQNNSMVQNSVPNNNIIQNTATNNNMQNCSPTPTNNVHYIVYSNNNSVANNGNCMQSYDMNNTNNTLQNYVPNNGNYVQNVVQNTTNTTQNLVAANDNSNMMQNNPNSNQNLSPNNGNSNQNLVQSADKIQQSMNMYQGQISLIEGTSCNYKQDITPIFQSSQNSIQSTLQSNTCIHAFLNEERALVQNTNSNEGKNVTNLPVDTKIEALMDLVKKHLKCTVMEDVNVLKHKILELKERIAQLEYENELLKNQYKRNNMQ